MAKYSLKQLQQYNLSIDIRKWLSFFYILFLSLAQSMHILSWWFVLLTISHLLKNHNYRRLNEKWNVHTVNVCKWINHRKSDSWCVASQCMRMGQTELKREKKNNKNSLTLSQTCSFIWKLAWFLCKSLKSMRNYMCMW